MLVVGTAAFWWSFDLHAVELDRVTSRTVTASGTSTSSIHGTFGGWECALRYRPAWPANIGIAVAPAFWLIALWLRSTWACAIGAAFCCLGTAVQAMCAFTGASEGVTAFREGYWVWLASSIVLTIAFSLLPEPERPPPGESLPPEVIATARTRFALAFAGLGTVFAVSALFWFGGFRRGVTLVTNDAGQALFPSDLDSSTLALSMRRPAEGAISFALLALPLVFLAAWRGRSGLLRVCGAVLAAATIVAQAFVPHDGYWAFAGFTALHPGVVHWFGSPAALLIAFVLLPTGRRSA